VLGFNAPSYAGARLEMHSANLYALLRSRYPDDPNAVFLESESSAPLLCYGDLDRLVARMGSRLRRLGVGVGDRVLVQAPKSADAVCLYLACLRSGAVFVPLNTAYTPDEVVGFLEDARPALLVCAPEGAEALREPVRAAGAELQTLGSQGEGTLIKDLENEPETPMVPRESSDMAAILYTSGTTGRSKGAVLSHGNLASNALALHALWRFVPGDVLLHALPIFHAHGLFVALHCALLNGSRVIFLPRFDASRVTALLGHATVFMGVPTFYTRLLALPAFGASGCEEVRLFVSGSAPLRAATHREFEARTGHRILERYGMTKAGMITSNPYDGERRPGTVGFALPDVEVRVADADGRPLEPGRSGSLEIRGPNVFERYWGQPEKTAQEFRPDGFFVTGDLAEMDEEGRVTLVGRTRDLVISGGYNVHPAEVEACIDQLPGVRESAVIGVPHPDLGEGVTAVVVTEPGEALGEETIRAGLAGRLAGFKQPKRIFFVDALPRNAMGKVQKNALRERFARTYTSAEDGQGMR